MPPAPSPPTPRSPPTSQVRDKPPKSHNGTRTLLLDPTTLTALTSIRPRAKAVLVAGYIFTGRHGQPLRPDNVSSRFNQLATAAGVRPIGPHQIRHLLASNLLDLGYGIPEVAERLGHDPATLLRYYSRVNAARRRQAAHDLADLITPTATANHFDEAARPRSQPADQRPGRRLAYGRRSIVDGASRTTLDPRR